MKCTMEGNNARLIGKAIQSLAKFGADLFVEADKEGIQLRTINATRSAVGTFKFRRTFFESYQINPGQETYCRIAMKAILNVFRCMKQVEHCEMCLLSDESKFHVKFKCRLETNKSTVISVVDDENITAAMTPSDTPNIICGTHKIFTEISNNFNAVEEEITLEAEDEHLTVKNYIEGSRVNDKFMRSQLKLAAGEFESYRISQETNVTFCLKEFRAFLSFAETINDKLTLHFDEAGSPMFLKMKKFDEIECLLIMSTLAPDDVSFYDDCRQSEVLMRSTTSLSNSKTTQKRKLPRTKDANTRNAAKTRRCTAEDTTLSNSSSLFRFHNGASNPSKSVDAPRHQTQAEAADNNLLHLSTHTPSFISHSEPNTEQETDPPVVFLATEEGSRDDDSQDEDVCIPQSPQRQPCRQLRSIFSRCFEATYVPKEPSPNSLVYVPSSDTED